jgi:hypothetical protein
MLEDINFIHLKKYEKKMKAEQFWAFTCYDRAFALHEQLSAKATATAE